MIAGNLPKPRRVRVAVLSGGDSDEWEISLRSGCAVADALRGRGHAVVSIDPAVTPLEATLFRDVDAAFLALHGRNGEDGRVQDQLDRLGVVYTGSGAEASRLAFSKSASKERFLQCGVPTPPYVLIHESDGEARIRNLADRVGFPLVVKPDSQGSSLGVSIVKSPADLASGIANCFGYDAFGLIERAVPGTEWTLGLIDEEPLPLIQIESPHEFFDFAAKYDDDATVYRFEFDDSSAVVASIVEAGRSAARAVGTAGLARVDLRVDRAGRPWVLEVNTIPGLTDHSLVPKSAARAGISLGELCEMTLEHSLAAATERGAALRTAKT